jgi:hypothetical protein
MKEIREDNLKVVIDEKSYPQEEKKNVYVNDKLFVLSSKKIQENSDIFLQNNSTHYYEINKEKKENIEKFFQIFKDDLLNPDNSGNLADILSFYLIKQNNTVTQYSNSHPKSLNTKHLTECKNINYSLNYNNYEEKKANSLFNLRSKYKHFKYLMNII